MPTGQIIINNALTALGILEQGGTPSVSDSNDALTELNAMWQAWGIDEGLIFSTQSQQFPLSANTPSYAYGPGGTAPFNVAFPQKVYHAHFIDSAGVRSQLEIVEPLAYSRHGDLSASAKRPDEVCLDFNVSPTTGSITLFLWPVPSVIGTLELDTAATFTTWALATVYNLPYGYQDAIQYALAWRLLPRYGMAVAQQVAEVIRELGQKSEARIVQMNAANRLKPPPPPVGPQQGGSPITTPAMGGFQGMQPKG